MNRRNLSFLFLLLLALMAFSCNSDSDEVSDGPDGELKTFGSICSDNADCQSGLCANAGSGMFCTTPCSTDVDCETVREGSCCDTNSGYCLIPAYCETDTPDNDGDEGSEPLCFADEMRCRGNDLERCNAAGDWELYRDCTEDGKVCFEDACVDEADGDAIADGDEPGCEFGQLRCIGDTVQYCNDAGEWEVLKDCDDDEICVDGQCQLPEGDGCNIDEGCEGDLEYCLPDVAGSSEGHCATYCDQPGVHCPRGWQCNHAVCEPIDGYCRTDADCELEEFCDMLPGASDGLCARYCELPGENCPELYRCIVDQSDINYGRCILEDASCSACSYDGECPGGYYCEVVTGQTRGCCRPQCGPGNPCPGALICDTDGRCVVGTGQGDCGGQCPPGYVCDPTFNQCVINCPACGENECCDAQSAPNCYTCVCQNPVVCGVLLQPCCFGFNCSAVVYGVIGYCI